MTRCDGCGRPRFLSPLGQVCPASDPDDPGFHDFSSSTGPAVVPLPAPAGPVVPS